MVTLRIVLIWLLCIGSILASSSSSDSSDDHNNDDHVPSGNGRSDDNGHSDKDKHGNRYGDSSEYKLMTTMDPDDDKSTTRDRQETTRDRDRSTTRDRPDIETTFDSIEDPFTTDDEEVRTTRDSKRTTTTSPITTTATKTTSPPRTTRTRTTRIRTTGTKAPPPPETTTTTPPRTIDETASTIFDFIFTTETTQIIICEGNLSQQPCPCFDGETCQAIEDAGRCEWDEVNEDCVDFVEETNTTFAAQPIGPDEMNVNTADSLGTTKNSLWITAGFLLGVLGVVAITACIWWYCRTLKPLSHESVSMNDESDSEQVEHEMKTNVIPDYSDDDDDDAVEVLVNDGHHGEGTGYTY